MEIILTQDVANLGYKNDIVKVKDGYARNFLMPRKMAIIANDSNRKQLAENLRQQAKKMAEALAAAQRLAEQLAAAPVTVAVKANEDGKIFGTVTTQNIADALDKLGYNVDKKVITVEQVKELGEHVAYARLHREVKAEIKLNVVAEKAE
ncbi:MAG: 50S ribosomal protein L9 [Paludibacteraceae bacterium]|nr:50S ribosomal protein L9 [Paludibacteraceae bacterium]